MLKLVYIYCLFARVFYVLFVYVTLFYCFFFYPTLSICGLLLPMDVVCIPLFLHTQKKQKMQKTKWINWPVWVCKCMVVVCYEFGCYPVFHTHYMHTHCAMVVATTLHLVCFFVVEKSILWVYVWFELNLHSNSTCR